MARMWAKILGEKQALSAIDRVKRGSKGSTLVQALKPVGQMLKTDQKRRAPRRTGFLEDHIEDTYNVGPHSAETEVGPRGVDYDEAVEFGTRFQAAQPYARPSLDENEARIQSIIRKNLIELTGGR